MSYLLVALSVLLASLGIGAILYGVGAIVRILSAARADKDTPYSVSWVIGVMLISAPLFAAAYLLMGVVLS